MTEATSRTSIELQQKTDFDEVKEMIYEFARTSIELQLQMKMNSSSNDPHFYRAAAESFYTILLPTVRNLAFSRGGACPTGRGSTLAGTPLKHTLPMQKFKLFANF